MDVYHVVFFLSEKLDSATIEFPTFQISFRIRMMKYFVSSLFKIGSIFTQMGRSIDYGQFTSQVLKYRCCVYIHDFCAGEFEFV